MHSFVELHQQPEILILPNAWDAASARIFEKAGFPAIGTTSGGIAFSLGYPDGQQMPWTEHLEVLRRIVHSVRVPVTADIEAGYGDLAAVVRDVAAAGIVGVNLEDAQGGVLLDLAAQTRSIREAKQASLFVNARTEVFLLAVGPEDQRLDLAIHRVKAFVDAGADCVFVPGLQDRGKIAELVRAAGAPVNILAGAGVPSIPELQQLGVKRVSVGSGPMRSAMGHTRRLAEALRTAGTYECIVDGAVSYVDANGMFRRDG